MNLNQLKNLTEGDLVTVSRGPFKRDLNNHGWTSEYWRAEMNELVGETGQVVAIHSGAGMTRYIKIDFEESEIKNPDGQAIWDFPIGCCQKFDDGSLVAKYKSVI